MIPERDTSSPLWKTVLASQHVAANKGEAFSVNVIDETVSDICKGFYKSFYYKSKIFKHIALYFNNFFFSKLKIFLKHLRFFLELAVE